MSFDFTTTAHAKWILAGEHAVLRHNPAVVFPLHAKTLTLSYTDTSESFRVEYSGAHSNEIHLLFLGVLEQALELIGHSLSDLTGHVELNNNIPIGSGMGVSAALSVTIGRWFIWKELIPESQLLEFARNLENVFHSESSGIDIAGAAFDKGIVYTRNDTPQILNMQWQPKWYLTHTDQIGMTSHCVKKVKDLLARDPELGKRIDQDMKQSVLSAIDALSKPIETGLTELAAAINKAKVCFTQWGLAGGKVETSINSLLSAGALAAKPTGSGDGGYILSLWEHEPADNLGLEFIAL